MFSYMLVVLVKDPQPSHNESKEQHSPDAALSHWLRFSRYPESIGPLHHHRLEITTKPADTNKLYSWSLPSVKLVLQVQICKHLLVSKVSKSAEISLQTHLTNNPDTYYCASLNYINSYGQIKGRLPYSFMKSKSQ